MTSNIQIPATLRPSRKKAAILFIFSMVFVLGGISMVRNGQPMGYFCGGFFALGLPIFALRLHPKAAFLRLEPDSFTVCSLFRSHTVRWAFVREFAVVYIGPNRMVAWNFTPEYPTTGSLRAISKSLSGCEAALPDTYGMKPKELVELMEGLRQSYANDRNS
jgi:hypothetical protein